MKNGTNTAPDKVVEFYGGRIGGALPIIVLFISLAIMSGRIYKRKEFLGGRLFLHFGRLSAHQG